MNNDFTKAQIGITNKSVYFVFLDQQNQCEKQTKFLSFQMFCFILNQKFLYGQTSSLKKERKTISLNLTRQSPWARISWFGKAMHSIKNWLKIQVNNHCRFFSLQNSEEEWQNFRGLKVREVTGYLILYLVDQLDSLEKLLPELRVIRGNQLFKNYALLIYGLMNLKVSLSFSHSLSSAHFAYSFHYIHSLCSSHHSISLPLPPLSSLFHSPIHFKTNFKSKKGGPIFLTIFVPDGAPGK